MVKEANGRLARLSAGHFDILINAANDLMLVFNRVGSADTSSPVFIYDGKDRAFLCKNDRNAPDKVFIEFPTQARDILNKAKDILCVEVDKEHIFTEYRAAVEVTH